MVVILNRYDDDRVDINNTPVPLFPTQIPLFIHLTHHKHLCLTLSHSITFCFPLSPSLPQILPETELQAIFDRITSQEIKLPEGSVPTRNTDPNHTPGGTGGGGISNSGTGSAGAPFLKLAASLGITQLLLPFRYVLVGVGCVHGGCVIVYMFVFVISPQHMYTLPHHQHPHQTTTHHIGRALCGISNMVLTSNANGYWKKHVPSWHRVVQLVCCGIMRHTVSMHAQCCRSVMATC